MNKKNALIIAVIIIAFAAVVVALLFLNPMHSAQTEASLVSSDAWKLERIQGRWASEDEAYVLDIDGYDCALKVNGVYAMVASLQFDASEKSDEENARFTLQIDPASVIYPDAEGAEYYEMDALQYEDGAIYVSVVSSGGVESGIVCLLRVETALPTWSLN